MRRSLVFLLFAGAAVLGMSGLGAPPANEIPTPEEFFAATITDRSLVVVRAENVACDGETFLKARYGRAEVTISFSRIGSITFRDGDSGYQAATVQLTDGTSTEVQVGNGMSCTGYTELGTMAIKVRDLYQVQFEPNATPTLPQTQNQ